MNNKRQFLLGIFFISALSILAFFTLFLTDTVDVFRKRTVEVVYFPDAHGLREGDAVLVAGVRIGRVKRLGYDVNAPIERRIRATLSLDLDNDKVKLLEGTRILIKESTLLGGRQIDIEPGPSGGAPLPRGPNGELFGDVEANPIAALSRLGDIFAENRERVANLLDDARAIFADVRAGKGVVGRLLTDDTLAANLSDSIGDLRRMVADVDAGKGLVGSLLRDPELAQSLKDAVESLRTVAADLQAGKGIAGRLIYDEDLSQQVSRAVETLNGIVERVQKGEGVAGRLLSDEVLGEKFEDVLNDVKLTSADISAAASQLRSGEGTIGKLLMDPELYEEALSAVRLLTRSLEDYREAAPVSIFTSTLFSAF
jgi:phospholipid/cholesterol/gamma-HCH transport system substrate-binding protein